MFLQTRIFVTGTCSDRYRQHDGSCCAQALKTGLYHPELPHPARRTYLEWLRGYLAHEGVDDPALLAALRKELLPYDHALLYGSRLRVRYAGRLARRALVARARDRAARPGVSRAPSSLGRRPVGAAGRIRAGSGASGAARR